MKIMNKKIITILHTDGWGNTPRVVTLLEDFCRKKTINIYFDFVVIKSDEDLKDYKFIGSPSIRINNLDVDPSSRAIIDYGFSWRLLIWTQDGSKREKMLTDAFTEAGWI